MPEHSFTAWPIDRPKFLQRLPHVKLQYKFRPFGSQLLAQLLRIRIGQSLSSGRFELCPGLFKFREIEVATFRGIKDNPLGLQKFTHTSLQLAHML